MRQLFRIIEGRTVDEVADTTVPAAWRVDLRRASTVGAEEIAAWRALLVRSGAADPVRADPDYLLPAARHQAGGRDLVFALAWAVGGGPERLDAVVPLALPQGLWGQGRIVPWQPPGTTLAPIFDGGGGAALRDALVERLRDLRPRAVLALDAPAEPAPRALAPRPEALPPAGRIPAASLVGVRAGDGSAASQVERIDEPHRIRDAVEAFLLLDAEVSARPIIADPSEAAMLRVVTRLFAQRRQVTVALTRRDGDLVAATVILGAGARAVVWRHVEVAAPLVPSASLTLAGAESYASLSLGRPQPRWALGPRADTPIGRDLR